MTAAGRIAERSCIITGGASGIGRGIAERLASEGASVCVADLDGERASEVADALRSQGAKAVAVRCDVADRESAQAMTRAAVEAFGRVDVVFNNAGVARVDHFLDIEEAHWDHIMRVNALGVLICMQEVAKQLIAQGDGGKIINTASIAGKQGFPLQAHYCASKFAVVGLTQAGARAFAEHGITVNAICPGVVNTEGLRGVDRAYKELGETQHDGDAMKEFAAGVPLGRMSAPSDVAAVALFLASADADYITGQAINVDGGMIFQ